MSCVVAEAYLISSVGTNILALVERWGSRENHALSRVCCSGCWLDPAESIQPSLSTSVIKDSSRHTSPYSQCLLIWCAGCVWNSRNRVERRKKRRRNTPKAVSLWCPVICRVGKEVGKVKSWIWIFHDSLKHRIITSSFVEFRRAKMFIVHFSRAGGVNKV